MELMEVLKSRYTIAIGLLVVATALIIAFLAIYDSKSPTNVLDSEKIANINGTPAHFFASESCNCKLEFSPVCGRDGNTYFNQCFAACGQKAIDTYTACGKNTCRVGNEGDACDANDPCTTSLICHLGTCQKPTGYICFNGEIVNNPSLCPDENGVIPTCPAGGEQVCTLEGERYLNSCYALGAGVPSAYIMSCQNRCSAVGQTCGGALYTYANSPETAYYSPTSCCNGLTCTNGICASSQSQSCQLNSTCMDTDGNNLEYSGSITNATGTYYDTCAINSLSSPTGYIDQTSGTFVKEYTCNGNANYYPCTGGICVNGRCMVQQTNQSLNEICSEDDGGRNYEVKGKTNGVLSVTFFDGTESANGTFEDHCATYGEPRQVEYYCQDTTSNRVRETFRLCQSGCNVELAKCNPVCRDEDGEAYNKKASVINETGTFTDTCAVNTSTPGVYQESQFGGNYLKEYTCSGPKYVACDCWNGECVDYGDGFRTEWTCFDSDGDDYFTQGTMRNKTGNYTDACTTSGLTPASGYYGPETMGQYLIEYTCSGTKYVYCPCSDGKCLSPNGETAYTCTDTNGYGAGAGSVTNTTGTFTDSCVNRKPGAQEDSYNPGDFLEASTGNYKKGYLCSGSAYIIPCDNGCTNGICSGWG